MGKHSFLKLMVTAAAVGGVCYAFRDKIKETKVYKSLDVEDKVEKAKRTIKEKVSSKDDDDREYFTLNEDDESTATDEAGVISEEAATTEDAPSDITAKVNDLLSDIPEIKISESELAEEATTDDAPAEEAENPEEESPVIYENDGLSDTSEDLDVLEEQDKLDI